MRSMPCIAGEHQDRPYDSMFIIDRIVDIGCTNDEAMICNGNRAVAVGRLKIL
jgi:hypothetical protein